MNKEQLEKLSDFDINSLIISSLEIESDVHFGGGSITRHVKNGEVLRCAETLDYCNNPSDMMPLVFEFGIELSPVFFGGWSASELRSYTYEQEPIYNENYSVDNNPLRAAAIVYLLIQGDNNG